MDLSGRDRSIASRAKGRNASVAITTVSTKSMRRAHYGSYFCDNSPGVRIEGAVALPMVRPTGPVGPFARSRLDRRGHREGGLEVSGWRGDDAEFVVTRSQVLDHCVADDDDPGSAVLFESTHGPQSGFQPPMVVLNRIARMFHHVVEDLGQQRLDNRGIGARLVRHDLGQPRPVRLASMSTNSPTSPAGWYQKRPRDRPRRPSQRSQKCTPRRRSSSSPGPESCPGCQGSMADGPKSNPSPVHPGMPLIQSKQQAPRSRRTVTRQQSPMLSTICAGDGVRLFVGGDE